ncbi:uncharacterized protein C2845_PM05G03640 [Panicum miliaceum]|uniref:Reverse transcriptase zinc-binding domain-containing protein n=1 Tax=Panicum miliaceum TaxID=4540 RepID=A0A3L6SY25_PANMI|nr:uncharacterized protein C2845_PM05G03640 [Panicum miliaceum]
MNYQINLALLQGNVAGSPRENLRKLLLIYRAITTTDSGDGCQLPSGLTIGNRSDNLWICAVTATTGSLCVESVPTCNSRVRDPGGTARRHDAVGCSTSAIQLTALDRVLHAGTVHDAAMRARSEADCLLYKFVWLNHALPSVRFFSWLLVQNKIQCKINLMLKNIVDDADWEVCNSGAESPDHLILQCPFTVQFCAILGITRTSNGSVSRLWELERPHSIPGAFYPTNLLLYFWQLWKTQA